MAPPASNFGFSADPGSTGSVCFFPGTTPETAGLTFRWGQERAAVHAQGQSLMIDLPSTHLAGEAVEAWGLPPERQLHRVAGYTLLQGEGWTLGAATLPVTAADLEARTQQAYAAIFGLLQGQSLYRCWNWVPRINEVPAGSIECYRLFSRGRSEAFLAAFAEEAEARMPAASAVGVPGDQLVVVFLAGQWPCRYWENPEQTPAFHYPEQYGPRAPSFSRATSVQTPFGRRLFISGTASIRGSESLFLDDLERQAWITAQNLELVAHTAGFGREIVDPDGLRAFRCYLRSPEGTAAWGRRWPQIWPVRSVTQAEVCRAELLIEIEGVLAGV
ncbi:MAG: hypothetical protein Q7P63_14750 [Verrucomicrobiota bacterium JB022]|nr:hypothetical protein [Verrucomicrobiota bacterium JB022]